MRTPISGRALRHREGEHAVDADRRQQERDEREAGEHADLHRARRGLAGR